MPKQEKQALLPKLRFPEFREAGEWDADELGKVAVFVNEKIPVAQVALENYVSTENILQDFGGVARASKLPTTGAASRFRPHDTLVSNIRPYLKKVWVADKEGGASNDVIVIRAKQRLLTQYFSYLLKNDAFIDYVMTGAKGVKMPRGDIGSMKEYPAFYPSKPEQQKIADCLASLDELITLEAQQLDTLKTHKKGLMQGLFPSFGGVPEGRGGEHAEATTPRLRRTPPKEGNYPRLRFPEFRDAGGWKEKRLGDVGNVRMCKRILKEQTSPRGDIPFYKIGTFGGVPDAYISREIFENFRNSYPFPKNGAVLISAAGTIGRTVRYNGELAYFQDSNIVWLDNSEKLIADNFLFYLYQLIDWSPSVGAIQRLYNENILGAQVKFPSIPEQQKIADCLASLDDLITAQTQKIATLKTHKKGLMQQLFPDTATTPPLRGTPPREGNKTLRCTSPEEGNASQKGGAQNSPPLEGWQAKPDGVVK